MENKELFDNYPDVLKPEDLQKILRIGRNAVYRLLKSGEIKSMMIAGKYRIPKPYLLEYLDYCSTNIA